MRYATFTTVDNEDNARMNVDPASPKTWIFGDETKTNKWGNMKAYSLKLDATPNVLIPDDHHTMPAFSYAKNHMTVTKYSEAEQTLSGPYDLNRLSEPQGALDTC